MKQIIKLFFLVMSLSLFVTSCDKDDNDSDTCIGSSNTGGDTLAGQWMDLDAMHIFSFSADKTGSAIIVSPKGDIKERSFKYSYNKKGGKLSIVFNDNSSPKTITFDIRLSGAANTMMELTCTSGNFKDLVLWGVGTDK